MPAVDTPYGLYTMRSLLSFVLDAWRGVDGYLFALGVEEGMPVALDDERVLSVWTNGLVRRELFNELEDFELEATLLAALAEWMSGGSDAFFFNLLSCLELSSFLPKNFNADTEEMDCWDILVD